MAVSRSRRKPERATRVARCREFSDQEPCEIGFQQAVESRLCLANVAALKVEPRRSRNLTHVCSQALTLVVRTDEQAVGWGPSRRDGGEAGVRLRLAVGQSLPSIRWWRTKAERQVPSRPSAAGGGGRRPALTGPAARPSSSTEVDGRRALGRGPCRAATSGGVRGVTLGGVAARRAACRGRSGDWFWASQ
jgi:hypothetical protein